MEMEGVTSKRCKAVYLWSYRHVALRQWRRLLLLVILFHPQRYQFATPGYQKSLLHQLIWRRNHYDKTVKFYAMHDYYLLRVNDKNIIFDEKIPKFNFSKK